MNKTLKTFITILNIIMLGVAGYWLYKNNEPEPLVVILGQCATILGLLFEEKVTKIFTKNVDNSTVKIKRKKTNTVHTEDIKDSDIDIS